jgi:hypothetical protein
VSTLSTTNLKNPSSGSNNIVLGTGGDTTITNNFTVSGTGSNSIAGTFQFNSGYGSVATAYGCRAWVNFNGTGTVAIRASGNVSSITDNGTGDYTVNFTTAMADANYCVQTSEDNPGSGASMGWGVKGGTTPTASAVNVVNYQGGAGLDRPYMYVAIFR